MPKLRVVFAVTGLMLVVACARTAEQAPSAPKAGSEPSAAPAAPAAEAPAAAAEPAPPPATTYSFKDDKDEEEHRRDEGFAQPADRDDLGQAVAELEQARAELDAALSPRKPSPARSASGAAASRGADLDAAAPAPKAEKKSSESSCNTACRAFASLDRAASAVCRLAGDKDARCSHAHAVLADAQKRVAVCGCHAE